MRKFSATLLTFALLALALDAPAQTRRTQPARTAPAASASAPAAALLAQLPTSDAVLTVDVKRLLTEELPRAYASNAAELARVNKGIDDFTKQTGIDARQFERVAFGVRYGQTASGATTMETVALLRGAFSPETILSAAKLASGGARDEQYNGRTIHVFNFDERVKLLGLFSLRLTEVAVAPLDSTTLAVGKLSRVREAIDAASGRGRVAPEIAALATRAPSALIGAGGNVPASATQGLNFLSPEFSRSIAAIRQFYGSVGATAEGFQMLTVLRTTDAASAKTLGGSIESLKSLAPLFIGQVSHGNAEKTRVLRGVVTGTRVNAQGEELQISLDLAQNDLAALIQAF